MQVQNANAQEQATVQNVNTFGTNGAEDGSVINDGQEGVAASTGDNAVSSVPPLSHEEFKRLQETNKRLLEESKRFKSRAQKAEEEKLLAENNKDEVIRRQREQLAAIDEKLMAKAITESIASEASKRNCKRWDHLFKVGNTEMLEYDSETETVSGVKEFFDYHQNDDEFIDYFKQPDKVETVNVTQSSASAFVDKKADPLGYLRKIKKVSHDAYLEEARKMRNEGLIN